MQKRHNNGKWLSNKETRRQRRARNKLVGTFFAVTGICILATILFNVGPEIWRHEIVIRNPLKTEAHAEEVVWTWRDDVRTILASFHIDWKTAQAVMFCESHDNPLAVGKNKNGTVDRGIWQENSIHGIPDDVAFDPIASTYAMALIYKKQGWNAWVAYKSPCYYKKLAELNYTK